MISGNYNIFYQHLIQVIDTKWIFHDPLHTLALIRYGYSTSRTCEIGLSQSTGISYQSIVYLVEKFSKPYLRSSKYETDIKRKANRTFA